MQLVEDRHGRRAAICWRRYIYRLATRSLNICRTRSRQVYRVTRPCLKLLLGLTTSDFNLGKKDGGKLHGEKTL